MTRYLLDTDALIDFSKGAEPATSQILSWIDGDETVALCAISLAEFFAGLSPRQAPAWERFVSALSYWHISVPAATRAGQERYAYARAGTTLSITDALLAAVAREQVATLVTGNVKDFPMPDLSLLALR